MHIRQAITTRFIGPTNYRGSRIVARASAGRKIYDWNHALGIEENHRAAARKFAAHMNWHGHWACGGLPSDDGYVFVLAESAGFVVYAQ